MICKSKIQGIWIRVFDGKLNVINRPFWFGTKLVQMKALGSGGSQFEMDDNWKNNPKNHCHEPAIKFSTNYTSETVFQPWSNEVYKLYRVQSQRVQI
jgi:hypothetical protein